MTKTAVFLAEGFEEVEALSVVDYLRRAGESVQTVRVPYGLTDKSVRSGYDKLSLVQSSHGVTVLADVTLEEFLKECGKALPDCVYVPGGLPGATNVAECQEVIDLIKKCFAAGKLVTAICAAPAVVLPRTGVLKGKKWTCYPGMEKDAGKSGTEGSQHMNNAPFVTDGNVVTGRGPGCAEQFAMELVRILAGEVVANKVHSASVQR